MKNTIFVRPNLKLILVGALLVTVVQHLIITGHSQGAAPLPVSARELDSYDMRDLLKLAVENPSSDAYMLLSSAYEKRGDYRKALMYLRKADRLRDSEEHPQ